MQYDDQDMLTSCSRQRTRLRGDRNYGIVNSHLTSHRISLPSADNDKIQSRYLLLFKKLKKFNSYNQSEL